MATSNVIQTRRGRVQFQGLFSCVCEMEFLWNPASINSNASGEESITVPGARLGDMVLISFDADHQGTIITGYVQANDTVDLVIHNPSGGSVDLPEANAHVVVLRVTHHHKS